MVRERLLSARRQDFEHAFGSASPPAVRRRARPHQSDRRAHRLQRRVRAADGDRSITSPSRSRRVRIACCARIRRSSGRRARCRSRRWSGARQPSRGRRSGRGGWFGYLAGVAWAMLGAGHRLRGADLAIVGDLPAGVGLSSSAALEIAVVARIGRRVGGRTGRSSRGKIRAARRARVRWRRVRHHGSVGGRRRHRGLRAARRLPFARDPRRGRFPRRRESSRSTAASGARLLRAPTTNVARRASGWSRLSTGATGGSERFETSTMPCWQKWRRRWIRSMSGVRRM